MSDVLAGMTRKEAEALVVNFARSGSALQADGLARIVAHPDAMEIYMALAALGARCVGATEAVVWASDCEPEPPWDGRCESLKRRVIVLEGE